MIQTRAGRSYVKSQVVTVRCYGSPAGRRSALDLDRSGSASARLTKVTGGDSNLDPAVAMSLLFRAEALQTEATVAPSLLARIAWPGRVLTGDALSCQWSLCRQVQEEGGDFRLVVAAKGATATSTIRTRELPAWSAARCKVGSSAPPEWIAGDKRKIGGPGLLRALLCCPTHLG